jgi:hypothetical protein
VLGAAANFAFHGGLLDKCLGVVSLAGAVGAFVILFRCQRRLRMAMSDWFGVKIKGLPLMNANNFDAFCQKHGLLRPNESVDARSRSGRTEA